MTRLLLAALLLTGGCAQYTDRLLPGDAPPLLPSACCWRADKNPPLARADDPLRVHGWCDVVNEDEVCRRKVGE